MSPNIGDDPIYPGPDPVDPVDPVESVESVESGPTGSTGPISPTDSADPIDGHHDPLDRLSALLDGELSPAERSEVEAYVGRNPEAQQELAALERVRTMVRSLPAVDPPFGFYERMLSPRTSRRRHRWPSAVAAVGVAAATIVLIVGITPAADLVVPPVAAYADRHLDMVTDSTDSSSSAFTPVAPDQLDEMGVPARLASGYERRSGYAGSGDVTHIVYVKGTIIISVYEQPGLVEWDALPPGGVSVQVGAEPMWDRAGPAEEIMVAAHGATIFTLVSVGGHDAMVEVFEAMPAPAGLSMSGRMSQMCRSVVKQFSFTD
jgi:hypothetical protein